MTKRQVHAIAKRIFSRDFRCLPDKERLDKATGFEIVPWDDPPASECKPGLPPSCEVVCPLMMWGRFL